MLAGLALVGARTKLGAGSGTLLQMRVGIATGLVIVGDLLADDPLRHELWFGGCDLGKLVLHRHSDAGMYLLTATAQQRAIRLLRSTN